MSQLRFLEYTPSSRAHCAKCQRDLKEGELRYGTEVEIQEHESVSWRCLHCVTKRQSLNLYEVAVSANVSVREKLLVPPPPSAGGDGPEDDVVQRFLQYLTALREDDEKAQHELRDWLDQHRHTAKEHLAHHQHQHHQHQPHLTHAELAQKTEADTAPVQAADCFDAQILNRQLRADIEAIRLLTVADLRALCAHFELSVDGNKDELEARLREHYETMQPENEKKREEKMKEEKQEEEEVEVVEKEQKGSGGKKGRKGRKATIKKAHAPKRATPKRQAKELAIETDDLPAIEETIEGKAAKQESKDAPSKRARMPRQASQAAEKKRAQQREESDEADEREALEEDYKRGKAKTQARKPAAKAKRQAKGRADQEAMDLDEELAESSSAEEAKSANKRAKATNLNAEPGNLQA